MQPLVVFPPPWLDPLAVDFAVLVEPLGKRSIVVNWRSSTQPRYLGVSFGFRHNAQGESSPPPLGSKPQSGSGLRQLLAPDCYLDVLESTSVDAPGDRVSIYERGGVRDRCERVEAPHHGH